MTVAAALLVEGLGKRFAGGEGQIEVLAEVGFTVSRGDSVAIVGPSGSGKSTLLGLIAGLDTPSSGRVVVDGTDLASLSPARLAAFRGARLGFVFQSYRLLPTLTALENVRVPLDLAGRSDAAEDVMFNFIFRYCQFMV